MDCFCFSLLLFSMGSYDAVQYSLLRERRRGRRRAFGAIAYVSADGHAHTARHERPPRGAVEGRQAACTWDYLLPEP